MNPYDLIQVGRELLLTALIVSAPAIIVSLLVGIGISVFQALTSIQEQTLNFAPRIAAVSVVLMILLPWTVQVLTSFAHRMFTMAAMAGPT